MKDLRRLLCILAGVCALLSAQPAPRGAGHWEGVLKAPNQDVALTVDLAKNQKGEWIGTLSMPAQGAQDIPLSDINVQQETVHFAMLKAPGAPVLEGKLSADGNAITGAFAASGQSIPFELRRTGEASIKTPPPSTPLSKEFEGNWEGALEAGGQQLRLLLKLSRAADGIATGSVTGIDQGNVEIPIGTITQKDKSLQFEIHAINGSYAGTLSNDGTQITGAWTQAGNSAPLVFKKAK
ncbi:MAG: hypothetical protein LAQ30_17200 [Acidobacteriia bacterium]|nr:hypothetical protein [Terriglobia bacterium]